MLLILFPFFISLALFINFYIGYSKLNNIVSYLYIINCLLVFDLLLYHLISKHNYILIIGEWFKINYLNIKWELIFNSFTITLLFLIIFITTHIQIYSVTYINNDISCSKFLSYISFFSFFMIIGILSNNFLILLIGWEGVGILSYLLINYYDNRLEANKSGIKAILINKIGDIGLLIGIISLYNFILSLKFNLINILSIYLKHETITIISKYELNILTFINIVILIAISAKSAQFIFNTWLPDAMEGPTPVSALLHSATMVGIGLLLLLKLTILFQSNNWFLFVIIIVASFTSFLTSLGGFSCYDIKSINANSTSSQISFMLLSYGNSNFSASYYHFITHACFKATLFLTTGLAIQQWNNQQDLRLIYNLKRLNLPSITTGFIITITSLIGLPSTLGSFSKEYILEINYSQIYSFSFNHWFLSLFSALLSTIYITLLFSIIINFKYQITYKKNNIKQLKGECLNLGLIVSILSLFLILLPNLYNIFFILTSIFDNNFSINYNIPIMDYLFNYWFIKILPFSFTLTFFFFIWFKYKNSKIYFINNIFNFNKFSTGLFIDKFYNTLVIKSFWYSYFLIFRLVSNKLLNPYNFIHKFIKIGTLFYKIVNRGGLDFYFFQIIYFLSLISLILII